ncbi:MAG: hypothetical protein GXO23_07035 [Crenarchaeota archaeon]|nr:hypothetical protein [Thermoproteota archaeon]
MIKKVYTMPLNVRIVEHRANSILLTCCSLNRDDFGYRLVWKVTSIAQMAVDLIFYICRNITRGETCNKIMEAAETLRKLGVISSDSVKAAVELQEMLDTMARLGGLDLVIYVRENLDQFSCKASQIAQDLLTFVDKVRHGEIKITP